MTSSEPLLDRSAIERILIRLGDRLFARGVTADLYVKAFAARTQDLDDLKLLADHLGLINADQVMALCARIFPDEPLPDRARLRIEDLFAA